MSSQISKTHPVELSSFALFEYGVFECGCLQPKNTRQDRGIKEGSKRDQRGIKSDHTHRKVLAQEREQ